MKGRSTSWLVAGLVGLGLGHLATVALGAPERDFSGSWQLQGWDVGVDPAGDPSYRGTVELTQRSEQTYEVVWKVGKNQNRGIGLFDPRTGVFAAGYRIGNSPGVAVYRISEDGRSMDCVGTFEGRLNQVAHEAWARGE